jgi:hypothetical protein
MGFGQEPGAGESRCSNSLQCISIACNLYTISSRDPYVQNRTMPYPLRIGWFHHLLFLTAASSNGP